MARRPQFRGKDGKLLSHKKSVGTRDSLASTWSRKEKEPLDWLLSYEVEALRLPKDFAPDQPFVP